jgi:hypothetical protein
MMVASGARATRSFDFYTDVALRSFVGGACEPQERPILIGMNSSRGQIDPSIEYEFLSFHTIAHHDNSILIS